jgi:hypothetical protein
MGDVFSDLDRSRITNIEALRDNCVEFPIKPHGDFERSMEFPSGLGTGKTIERYSSKSHIFEGWIWS